MGVAVTLSTSAFFPDTEMSFRAAAELGYDGVEVMVNHDRRSQSLESVEALANRYGVHVRSVHVPCLVVTQHVWGWNPEAKLRRTVDMASDLGAETVVVHPPFRWQKEFAVTFAEVVASLNQGGGPIVAVENMYSVDAFGKRVNPYLCNDDSSFPGFEWVVLDTSHAAAARVDTLELYEQVRGRVRQIHLSDSTGTKGDEHLPPGLGRLPLHQLAEKMVADGYDGDVVLEIAIQRLPESTRVRTASDSREWTAKAFSALA